MAAHGDRAAKQPERTLVFFTNLFPYTPGEEFIEAEIGFLADSFDRVVVVPVAPYQNPGEVRELPEGTFLFTPAALNPQTTNLMRVAAFGLRHPLTTAAAVARALRRLPRLRRCLEDFKLDLFSCMVIESVLPQLTETLEGRQHCVFYSYWMHAPARSALQLRRRLRRPGIPVVTRAHGYDVYSERKAIDYLPQRELLFAGVEHVFTASEHGRDYLRARYPRFAGKIDTSHLGVTPAAAPHNAARDERHIVTCAYLREVKRIPLLIDGITELQRRGMQVRWTHLGGGEGSHADAVRAKAATQLAPGSFEFVGNLSNDGVRAWHAAHPASVFVNVSESEGVPVSIMEALAQGLPVVATDVGGNSELIDVAGGMFDGLLPSNATAEDIADRIETLLDAPQEQYRAYAAASFSHWQRNWSSEKNYGDFARYLQALAARG
ncbi:glycosyltransferase [Leucobacter muris]|uniref:Glycosyltransferase n=1 Tax=Leucobacter muris TaxID=1935379 RepID=A0ABX5QCN1_9MICO|nr:glycosyltransferase [Leucobacter muris]QAB16821.1 glycosyltransferase [Leucobacter muris]